MNPPHTMAQSERISSVLGVEKMIGPAMLLGSIS